MTNNAKNPSATGKRTLAFPERYALADYIMKSKDRFLEKGYSFEAIRAEAQEALGIPGLTAWHIKHIAYDFDLKLGQRGKTGMAFRQKEVAGMEHRITILESEMARFHRLLVYLFSETGASLREADESTRAVASCATFGGTTAAHLNTQSKKE